MEGWCEEGNVLMEGWCEEGNVLMEEEDVLMELGMC